LLKTKNDSTEVTRIFLENNISVVDGAFFRGLPKNFIRVAIGTEHENEKFIETILRMNL